MGRMASVINYIHNNLRADLRIKVLANVAACSEAHLHRSFKKMTGCTVHRYICDARMSVAAHYLLSEQDANLVDVAHSIGFGSVSAFSKAFKQRYGHAPGQWLEQERLNPSLSYQDDHEISACFERFAAYEVGDPELLMTNERFIVYKVHQGYDRTIKQVWNQLQAWALSESIQPLAQLAILHSDPALISLKECIYTACLEVQGHVPIKKGLHLKILPGGLYARFSLKGRYGELLPMINAIMQKWLPSSGLKLGLGDDYLVYHQNQFQNVREVFDVDYYLPVRHD